MSIVRYRYRVHPSPGQAQALARAFSCARVVYNDALRARQDAHERGEKLSRNGFTLRPNGRLYVAKIGEQRVEWSRTLPSEPSSATVIREPDGRCYASFVVERATAPLPMVDRDVGVDPGLDRLAVLSDGTVIDNPGHLRSRQRRLARAQRVLCRKQRGSANRRKALRVVRDNQAVHLEDVCVAGLARTRLARSIHDAGWSTPVRLIEQKAAHHGRLVVRVGRWFPSSQRCSTCGHLDGRKPLKVRWWTCSACGTEHDRDLNAARNVLAEGRRVAAGLADTGNACGGGVRPGPVLAAAGEAGTHRGVA